MKIANLLRRFSFTEWGGTESAAWNLTMGQHAMGHEVEMLSTTALCPLKKELRNGVKIRRFSYFYPHLFLNAKKRLELDKKGGNPFSWGIYRHLLAGRYDIIHSHAVGRISKEAIMVARKQNIPCVLSFHGGYYDVPKSEFDYMARPLEKTVGYGKILEKLWKLPKDTVEACDGIICVGQNELKEIEKRFPGKPAVCIPNGVNARRFDAVPGTSFRDRYRIPADRKLILCVSRIDPQKNQRMLLRLLKRLLDNGENAHLALVGFVTSTSYRNEFTADTYELGVTDRVTICEGLPPTSDMLLSAYKSADVFALASVHEPFGIVALEAWSAEIPLIASAVGGLKTLVKNGETGYLFSPNSDDEMVEAYYNAMKHRETIVANAKHESKTEYSWEAVTQKTIDFYKLLIDGKKRK